MRADDLPLADQLGTTRPGTREERSSLPAIHSFAKFQELQVSSVALKRIGSNKRLTEVGRLQTRSEQKMNRDIIII